MVNTYFQYPDITPQDQQLLLLLNQANLTSNGWADFLDAFADHFQLRTAHLYFVTPQTMHIRFQDWGGKKPSEQNYKAYAEKYVHYDPFQKLLMESPIGRFYASNLDIEPGVIESSLMAIEWAQPQGMIYGSAAIIYTDGEWVAALNTTRSEEHQPYTREELSRLTAFVPYIEKAMKLRVAIAERNNDKTRLQALINKFAIPMILLNEFGEIICANNKIDQLIPFFPDLISQPLLTLGNDQQNRNLYINIADCVSEARGRSLGYQQRPFVIGSHNESITVIVEEMLEKDNKTGEIFVGAFVYFVNQKLITSKTMQQLIEVFSFTKKEAASCQQFLAGLSIQEIANQTNRSVHTVREQLQNCYRKTNSKNQLELINLLASLPAG